MNVKAYGTFESFESKIFRTNTHLQWGNSEEPIGLVIMLNPGSSRLANDKEWNTFLSMCEAGKKVCISSELEMDPTMESLLHIFSKINPKLEGVLHIYNLFNYRCGKSKDAIRAYSSLLEDTLYSSLLHSPIPDIEFFSWVWTAWSVEDAAVLNNRKFEILKKVPEKKKIALYSRQKKHQTRKELFCYHPCPQQKATREWVHTEIIKELKDYYRNNGLEKKELSILEY